MFRSREIHLLGVSKRATTQGFLCVPVSSLRCKWMGLEWINVEGTAETGESDAEESSPRPLSSGRFGRRERQRVDEPPLAGARGYPAVHRLKLLGRLILHGCTQMKAGIEALIFAHVLVSGDSPARCIKKSDMIKKSDELGFSLRSSVVSAVPTAWRGAHHPRGHRRDGRIRRRGVIPTSFELRTFRSPRAPGSGRTTTRWRSRLPGKSQSEAFGGDE